MNKYIKFSAAAALALGMTGCTGSFDEINTDPDAYTSAPATNMLANCLYQMGDTWGDELSRLTDWSGYMVASYANETFVYKPSYNEFGNKFSITYRLNSQLQDIINNNPNAKNMVLVSKLLQQYLYFDNVDCFGDCPYTEGAKGASGGTTKPVYDSDIDIYHAIADSLKSIADQWAAGMGDDELGNGDLLYGGKVKMWQCFCNSLRLRLAMRLSNMSSEQAASKATFQEIIGNPTNYPVIETCSQNCYFWWSGSSSYRENWYDAKFTRSTDYNMSQVLVDRLKSQNDPRLETICQLTGERQTYDKEYKLKEDSLKASLLDSVSFNKKIQALIETYDTVKYRGVLHGAKTQYDGQSFNHFSVCSDLYYGNAAGFTPYFRAAETWFLIEEAALKGWISYDPQAAYKNAIACSMEDNGIAGAEDAYLAGKGAYDGTLDQLYMEEWVALFKQSQEAWSLYRRTGYPKTLFDEVTYNDGIKCPQYPGERCAWGYGASATHTDLPFRFPYPESEFNYNADNVNEHSKNIKDYCWGERLCWALENGRK